MKAIQITMDERLLARLDADADARSRGRSAVIRRAVSDYLRRKRQRRIDDAYDRAYAGGKGLGDEFAGWAEEGSWPDE